MMIPKVKRKRQKTGREPLRSPEHRAWVRMWQCLICLASAPNHAHHVKTKGAGGGDEWCVPLCAQHHSEIHNIGRDTFAKKYGMQLKRAAYQNAIYSPDRRVVAAAEAMLTGDATEPL